ncbi:MAG: molybdopterin molybdotransferase MoeA [Proteobacteria bacterium]|nr:molybdopterin molybdotransferase MoeA [Pseudomonadota bacterium]
MLSVADATRAVLARLTPTAREIVPLAAAEGRILAEDLVAARVLPGFDHAAMDGYAVRAQELPGTLPIAGVVAAGDRGTTLAPGTALRIFTGAPLPPGADTVVMQENATVDGDPPARVTLPAAPLGDNIRRAGEDVGTGEVVYRAGTRLRPWDLAVGAALGVAELDVHRRPRVALLATGDELVDVDVTPQFGQLVASSRYALAALIREAGGEPIDLGIVSDDKAALAAAFARAWHCDAVITTGGVSVGDRDYVREVLARVGVTPEVWKVAMKPGKPFSFGLHGQVPVFGLPGNPVSTLVGFELFVRPALLAMQGATRLLRPRATVHLASAYRKAVGRAHYVRAHVVREGDRLVAHAHPKQGSAMLSSLVTTNAFVELAAERGDVAAGEAVPALLLEII